MRKVMVSEYKKAEGTPMRILQEKGVAEFHQFGVDFEELENGTGNYSTAIVEWPDGKISNVAVQLVRFLE